MPPAPRLWKITITCESALAEAVEAALTDEAVAITALVPPRSKTAQIEALYNKEPGKYALNALKVKLAVLAALRKKDSPSPAKTKDLLRKPKFSLPLPLSGERGIKKTSSIAPQVRVENVGNLDWLKKVAADFPPLAIGRWTIYGNAHRHAVKDRRLKLRIDATNAFGTGEHPTTRGCLLMLDRVLKRNSSPCHSLVSDREDRMRSRNPKGIERYAFLVRGPRDRHPPPNPPPQGGRAFTTISRARSFRMLDLGCGSGILAMAFAKACKESAVAVDLDPDSVVIARGNVRANGLQAYVRVGLSRGYASALVSQQTPYDLIMANIFARPLCQMAKDLKRHLRPGGVAILSGLLSHQANAVLAAHRQQGLFLTHRLNLGEWSVLALQRPKSG